MKPYSLATVLIKVMGLYFIVLGLSHVVEAAWSIISYATVLKSSAVPKEMSGQLFQSNLLNLSHPISYALVFLGSGVLLLGKTDYVVRAVLKIPNNG